MVISCLAAVAGALDAADRFMEVTGQRVGRNYSTAERASSRQALADEGEDEVLQLVERGAKLTQGRALLPGAASPRLSPTDRPAVPAPG